MNDIVLDAIKRANKLGAMGLRVNGATLPTLATQEYRYTLAVDKPEPRTASEKPWYEDGR